MELHELQFARRAHHDAREGKPLRPADTVRLLNIVWAEEKRADVAEETLKSQRQKSAEANLDRLFGQPPRTK